MLISIVIVNWNSKDYLRSCLQSLEAHASDIETEIIVVDGASFDGCGEMLETEFPQVQFIQSEENIGFGRCNNLGVESANGEYLLLLNPDTEIKSNAIQALLEACKSLPQNSMLGARLLNSDGTLQTTSVHAAPTPLNQALGSDFLMKRFPKSKLWGTYEAYHSDTPTEVEAISGACMFLPTKLFRELGGFNPIYFMYAEDMDLCLKIRRSGFPIYHIPNSEITHHGGSSSNQQAVNFSAINIRKALYRYFLHNFGHSVADRYRTMTCFSAIVRIPMALFAINKASRSLQKWYALYNWSTTQPKHSNCLI